MGLLHQAGAAIVLVTLTLAVQCAGMAALIDWVLGHFGRDAYRLGPVHSAALIVRFTSVMIVLHILQILLWAGFYRWQCFPSSEAAFYSSTSSYSTGRLWGCDSTANVADPGAGGRPHGCTNVWPFCELVVRHRDPARRSRGAILTEAGEICGPVGIYACPFDRLASSRFHAVTIGLKRGIIDCAALEDGKARSTIECFL
jgi:hypothetical protein